MNNQDELETRLESLGHGLCYMFSEIKRLHDVMEHIYYDYQETLKLLKGDINE